MRGLIALLIVAVIAFGVYQFYISPQGKSGSPGSMMQAISTTGVKNDLIAIAQAERRYVGEHGNYATMDELTSSGALATTSRSRQGYTYSVEVTTGGFIATARYTGPANPPGPSFTVDQTLQIRPVE
jgi:hypothetical protein